MMKKMIALLLVVAMIVAISAGCRKNPQDTPATEIATEPAATEVVATEPAPTEPDVTNPTLNEENLGEWT